MKYFSIDRVFRNETLDATHLAEFHQVEGVIADYNIGLSHLLGIMDTFFKKIGLTKLKYKPAFNPYTEPSLEIFGTIQLLKDGLRSATLMSLDLKCLSQWACPKMSQSSLGASVLSALL